jgi:3-methyladenine DNA glycosylase AlkD
MMGGMADALTTAEAVVARLESLADESQLDVVRKRLAPGEPAIGMRMRDLFAAAKQATGLPLGEVERLMDEAAYEPRMVAFCVLDFKARRRIDRAARQELFDLYLRRHDAITTWDMVDRSAPRVVGLHLLGGPYDVLRDLAGAENPYRRRTSITAPLSFVYDGGDADLAEGLALAATLHADPEPVVSNAVGIFLKHASGRDRAVVEAFVVAHEHGMPRPAYRLATERLRNA